MCPKSSFTFIVSPYIGSLGPKYMLLGYMDPKGFMSEVYVETRARHETNATG